MSSMVTIDTTENPVQGVHSYDGRTLECSTDVYAWRTPEGVYHCRHAVWYTGTDSTTGLLEVVGWDNWSKKS